MSERKSRGNMGHGGRWIFALATLTALVLVLAVPSRAQAQSAGSKSGQASTHPSARAAAAPKGQSEGIQVHGHWTIEVRNPDGKPVKHVEFENALSAQTGGPLLTALIGGNNSPGAWAIFLGPTSVPGICTNTSFIALAFASGVAGGLNGCVLAEPAVSGGSQYFQTCSDANGCFPTLSANETTQGVALAGTMTAETSGTINEVATTLMTCSNNVSPVTCYTSPPSFPVQAVTLPSFFASQNNVTGATSGALPFPFPFGIALTALGMPSTGCGGTGQLPCPVPVAQGQAVAVSVVISFH